MNNSLKKAPMPEQPAQVRNHNFSEVSLGYSAETAMEEAARCLHCKNRPCVSGCPVGVPIPEFIGEVAKGNFAEAYEIITTANSLPAICGRVCPQESQCESKCVRGLKGEPVAIGRLERFVADWKLSQPAQEPVLPPANGMRVAVIGAGPAGLTCAGDLAKKGYAVTVFEALHTPGGVLVYGIPEFRLPKAIVATEIANLQKLGVTIKTNEVVGRIVSVDELFEQGYQAVFIGSGAGLPSFMGIPGESLIGVYSANEYLTRINLMKAYRPEYVTPIRQSHGVAVVGGGNVAMDAARCAKRMDAEVTIIYRRSLDEMPARREEVHHAMEEGIVFRVLASPTAVVGDEAGQVSAIRCTEMELGEPDASGRRRPVEKAGSEFTLAVDTVIIAI
ncbi:MAG: NADPH-dependent glutamate synthase, partial [Angelakisella sp.]